MLDQIIFLIFSHFTSHRNPIKSSRLKVLCRRKLSNKFSNRIGKLSSIIAYTSFSLVWILKKSIEGHKILKINQIPSANILLCSSSFLCQLFTTATVDLTTQRFDVRPKNRLKCHWKNSGDNNISLKCGRRWGKYLLSRFDILCISASKVKCKQGEIEFPWKPTVCFRCCSC